MKLTLKRIAKRDTYTIGRLYVDGRYFCDTAEPTVRELGKDGSGKVAGKTAIPCGTYKLIMKQSPKFGRLLPTLCDVPFFKGILIHRGNVPLKDSQGCILVGENKEVGKVLNSTYWEGELVKLLRYEHDVKISVVDA